MKITLDALRIARGDWQIAAEGTFTEGIHLISGDVGSGKTTLALALAGLGPATEGRIIPDSPGSRMISFQFPEYHVTGTTVAEECASWGLDPGRVLSGINMASKSGCDPLRLSRGELKRLHLACVLARDYDLLILDEPFSSLDVCEKQRICRSLSGRRHGITIIFTHEQAIFPRVDNIWEIRKSRLHSCGTPPDALADWEHAPAFIRALISRGRTPKNISPDDLGAAL